MARHIRQVRAACANHTGQSKQGERQTGSGAHRAAKTRRAPAAMFQQAGQHPFRSKQVANASCATMPDVGHQTAESARSTPGPSGRPRPRRHRARKRASRGRFRSTDKGDGSARSRYRTADAAPCRPAPEPPERPHRAATVLNVAPRRTITPIAAPACARSPCASGGTSARSAKGIDRRRPIGQNMQHPQFDQRGQHLALHEALHQVEQRPAPSAPRNAPQPRTRAQNA